jgi:DNA invertase Pin-like site-specific DNA recombinase
MADAMAGKFQCLLVWKLDRFGRSLVDCWNNIKTLEDHGIRSIAVTQGLDTACRTPHRDSCCMCWVPPQDSKGP